MASPWGRQGLAGLLFHHRRKKAAVEVGQDTQTAYSVRLGQIPQRMSSC